jgi:hypothetical protein
MAHRIRKLQARLAPDDDPDDYVLEWVPDPPQRNAEPGLPMGGWWTGWNR